MKTKIMMAALIGLVTAASVQAAPPRNFLRQAIQGDNAEVQMGQLALRKGRSSGVREFGRMLVADHGRSRSEAAVLARRYGVAVPRAPTPGTQAKRRQLERLSGRAFDRQFARMMAAEHRETIAKFEQQVRTGDRRTASFARKTLPTLRHHLDMAEDLRR